MRHVLSLLALLAATSCTHLAGVEQGIRTHRLVGTWQSERGDHLLIGCSGAFNAGLTETAAGLPTEFHESGSHISEVTPNGFTVSHWPLTADTYDVAAWPHKDPQGRVVMTAEGMEWVKSRPIDCD